MGRAALSVRARALCAAGAAGDRAAERQALIDLAAACLSCASMLPAPAIAVAELEPRTGGPAERVAHQAAADRLRRAADGQRARERAARSHA